MNTQSIADYLAQLLKDKKQLAAFPNVFIHMERLLDEGESRDKCYNIGYHDIHTGDTDINQIKQRVYFKEVTKILSSAFMLSLEQVSTTVSIFQTDKTAARQCRQPGC